VINIPSGLPDPADHTHPWWNGEPALYAWWQWAQKGQHQFGTINHKHNVVARYSEAVPTRAVIERLAALGPIIEVGAGGGYWARLLRDVGGDIIATDLEKPEANSWYGGVTPWTDVQQATATDAVIEHPERVVFSCWPPRPNGYMADVLDITTQKMLALITNGRVAFGEDPMYDRLERSWTLGGGDNIPIPTWPYRCDRLMIWRR